MTREEAIARIKDHKAVHKMNEPKAIYISEALDIAIKALEQQPCDDCLSRQAVNNLVDELARAISDERCYMSRGRSTGRIMQDILDLPSVAPKQQPCEDAVSRQAVLDSFWKLDTELRPSAIDAILNMINNLPSVTPKEKVAEWHEENGCEGACEGYMSAGVICSQCGEVFCGYIGYNFCPNCGARMIEPQESEDKE